MFRSRIFWNLFASFAAILVVTGLLVGWQIQRRLQEGLLSELETTLENECRILAPFAASVLPEPAPARLHAELQRLKQETGLRVTLVRPDGSVLGDSHQDPLAMDDHSSRPEILAARTQAFGSSRRRSHTLGTEMLYVAQRLEAQGKPLGFVRLSLPVSHIEAQLSPVRRSVLLGTSVGLGLALLLGLFLARQFTAPIAAMTSVARELLAGNYSNRATAVRKDEIGVLGATLNALGSEITRRIASLSEEDAQLRAILASMIEGVVAVDQAGRVAFMNLAAQDLLDVRQPTPEGQSLWALAPVRELEELLTRARERNAHESIEVELHRGGRERVFQAHASPFLGGGKAGLVLVLHDIGELRRLERVRRDFVANVSHELKTPLTSIQGFVETLLSGALHDSENNVRFLQRIEANVKRLTSLVTDLLSLARIESGQLDVQRALVDWRDVLDSVLRLREPALHAKGLTLQVLGCERPLCVRGDREAMTQVLDNLIDNALQYTPAPGRVTVRLEEQGDYNAVVVEDTGIGIPPGDLDRIFERFYRVDKARSRAAGGTGLGLSIVKNLVLRMDGEVSVSSIEGRGSIFSARLPRA